MGGVLAHRKAPRCHSGGQRTLSTIQRRLVPLRGETGAVDDNDGIIHSRSAAIDEGNNPLR